MSRVAAAVLVCLSALFAASSPGQSVPDLIKAARERIGAADYAKAAQTLGAAAAKAQRDNDIRAEQKVAEVLRDFPVRSLSGSRYSPFDACSDVLKALDPKRAGAFVAPAALAAQMLREQTVYQRLGGSAAVFENAVKVLETQAALPTSGKGARLLARYARTVLKLKAAVPASGSESRAVDSDVASLEEMLGECLAEDWFDPAIYLSVEIAAQHLHRRQTEAARTMLAMVGSSARPDHRFRVTTWRNTAAFRFAGTEPAPIFEPIDETAKRLGMPSPRVVFPKRPKAPEEKQPSKLGRVFNGLSSTAPFVTIRRLETGFEVREGFDKAYVHEVRLPEGLEYSADGGVALVFAGRAVALHEINLIDEEKQRLPDAEVPPFAPFYLLAKGETLTITKAGTVSIKGP